MAWDSYLEKNQDRFVDELSAFISIPSVSAADEHFQDVVKAGEWVVSKLQSIGISNARLMKTQTHPVVYGDWLHAGDDKPTVLIYGHFDVQPADPYELWDSPPFQPQIKNNKIYVAGSSDDKGQMYMHLKAYESLKETVGIDFNIKFLIISFISMTYGLQ